MENNAIKLKTIEKRSNQRYHINAVKEGKVVFDSAFSNPDSIEPQLLTAVDEWLNFEEDAD